MVTTHEARSLALGFPEATEESHFQRTSFRVRKKIFLTMDEDQGIVVVRLSLVDQQVFVSLSKEAVTPVKGAWGAKGWTNIELGKVSKELFKDAIELSYCGVAPKQFASRYFNG